MARGQVKTDEERRAVYLGVRLTADERQQLQRAATAQGLTASDLVREGLTVILGQAGQNLTPATDAGSRMN
jgi:uncharacterized protein (DUF1778 family)